MLAFGKCIHESFPFEDDIIREVWKDVVEGNFNASHGVDVEPMESLQTLIRKN